MKAKRYMKPKPIEHYRDRRGFPYDLRTLLVPARIDQWPKYPPRVKDDKDRAQRAFHEEFGGGHCWLCGLMKPNERKELHHLAAGSRGRSMERELFTFLCHECHVNITPADLPKLLWAKWKFDNEWFDVELLTIRHGFHLPELEAPDWCKEN